MNKFLLACTLLLLFSCSDQKELENEWQLFEVSLGIGPQIIYQETTSMKSLLFFDNGDVEIENGDLCWAGNNEGENTAIYNSETGEISTKCNSIETLGYYTIIGDTLKLSYLSIEPTYERYKWSE